MREHTIKSAIELYKEAYELDYNKGDWEQAEEIYRRIVNDYPHSEEKEYVQVHLERIERLKSSAGDDEPLRGSRSSGAGAAALGFVSLILGIGLACGSAYLYQMVQNQTSRIQSQAQLIEGLHALLEGNVKTAELSFRKAELMWPNEETTYKLLVETYLRDNKIDQAQAVLKKWRIVSPFSKSIPSYEKRIKKGK